MIELGKAISKDGIDSISSKFQLLKAEVAGFVRFDGDLKNFAVFSFQINNIIGIFKGKIIGNVIKINF